MKVLKTAVEYFKFVGLSTKPLVADRNEFLQTWQSYFYIVGFIALSIVPSGCFMIRNYSDVENATNALEVFACGIEGLGAFVSIGFSMKLAKSVRKKVQKLCDQGTFSKELNRGKLKLI